MTTEISKKYESYGGLSISNQSAYMKIWVAKNKEKRSDALKRYAEKKQGQNEGERNETICVSNQTNTALDQ